MTKEEKVQAILQVKAECLDDIYDLSLTLDSNRNFHRRVVEALEQCNIVIQGIKRTKEVGEHFHCSKCNRPATSQLSHFGEDSSVMMCEEHANEALILGEYDLIEE